MLALTEDACQAIGGILERSTPGAGMRIAPNLEDGGTGLQLSVAPGPAEGDQVIDSDGGPVFVDALATPLLDDKVLDANVTDRAVQFEILAAM
jgi:Fe-S cluster assembly iron-binding protein IscA